MCGPPAHGLLSETAGGAFANTERDLTLLCRSMSTSYRTSSASGLVHARTRRPVRELNPLCQVRDLLFLFKRAVGDAFRKACVVPVSVSEKLTAQPLVSPAPVQLEAAHPFLPEGSAAGSRQRFPAAPPELGDLLQSTFRNSAIGHLRHGWPTCATHYF